MITRCIFTLTLSFFFYFNEDYSFPLIVEMIVYSACCMLLLVTFCDSKYI